MQEYTTVLRALYIALIEIRAAKSLTGAHMLADIFHNCPLMMAKGDSEEEIIAEIVSIASRHGFKEQILSFLKYQD